MGAVAGVAAAVVSVGGSILGGQKKRKEADRAAAAERAASEDEARMIRKNVREVRSSATAAYAASGVDVSEGTPLVVERDITQSGEEDALTTILYGHRRSAALRRSGKNAQDAAYFDAASSALGAFGDYKAGKWKT